MPDPTPDLTATFALILTSTVTLTLNLISVPGNTAAMCGNSWLAPHFEIIGDTNTHYGLFDCAPTGPSAVLDKGDAPAAAGGCC